MRKLIFVSLLGAVSFAHAQTATEVGTYGSQSQYNRQPVSPATTTTLGSVIVGTGLSVDARGVLSASGSTSSANVTGTTLSITGKSSLDNGAITSNGSGALSVGNNLTVGGIATLNGILNVTNTSGMISLRSAGTSQSWYMRRSAASVTSGMYTLISSYNGSSTNNVYLYDSGVITTGLGTVANLSAPAQFSSDLGSASLTGTGNAYACVNASGVLYRSATACQ